MLQASSLDAGALHARRDINPQNVPPHKVFLGNRVQDQPAITTHNARKDNSAEEQELTCLSQSGDSTPGSLFSVLTASLESPQP